MSPDPQVFDHFNAEAQTYAMRSGGWLWGPLRRHEGKAIMRALDPQPGERILDAGCGAGHYMELIRQRGAEVRGVDGAEVMVAAARRRGLDAELHDLEAASPPGGPYDKILCAGALEFCREPQRVVHHLAGALRPGGRLVVFVPRNGFLGGLYRWSHRRHGLRIHLFRERDLWGGRPRRCKFSRLSELRSAGWCGPRAWVTEPAPSPSLSHQGFRDKRGLADLYPRPWGQGGSLP